MPSAVYQQHLDPLAGYIPGSAIWSTCFAAVPVVVLFWLLVPRRWLASKAGAVGALSAIVVAIVIYGMPPLQALAAFGYGAAFGILPVGWTIFNTMLLYNITVQTGKFDIVRRSVASLSGDARIQAILIAFAFGAFLEGAAGGGTPVAICGAILVGLGFDPFKAAVLCLIANTSPVAYGGLSTPLITLTGVTGIPTETLSIMAGHQLPFFSLFVPLYMVRCMCSWRQTREVWPALLVSGGSFAGFQLAFATCHKYFPGIVLYPMTDIGGGIFSLGVTAIFLQYWKPRTEFHFSSMQVKKDATPQQPDANDAHATEARAMLEGGEEAAAARETPLDARSIIVAWMPFAIMSLLLLFTGLIRQREESGPVRFGPLQSNYKIPVPGLHNATNRDPALHPVKPEQAATFLTAGANPMGSAANAIVAEQVAPRPEKAEYNFAWISSPGTPVFLSAVISMFMLRMDRKQIARVIQRTAFQMKVPIPTIAFMLGLSYVTRYAGMDATLGVAFAGTGLLYPFFAALLGWLGVFLTGTDAGSNALFGSLQKITAQTIYPGYHAACPTMLSQDQLQILICTANSTGGVMGKMIDAQSIVVSTAATNQLGREADIFKAVLWHSIFLACAVGLLCLLQAYVGVFASLVPALAIR
jgi:lactate permease